MNFEEIFGGSDAPKEPSAQKRLMESGADGMFELFSALVRAGFSENQALQILLATIVGVRKEEGL